MNWRTIKRLKATPFFHYAPFVVIGVPILAELLLWFRRLDPDLSLPRILVVGFTASVLFVFSNVVYHHFCPSSVKEYQDEKAFAAGNQESYERSQKHRRLEVVLANLEESEEDIRTQLEMLKRSGLEKELNDKLDELYSMAMQRYLVQAYGRDVNASPIAIWVAALLYVGGAILALWIMFERVVAVYHATQH
jgi:hypothetical protein